jgi:DNA-binding YbaB/EbfC family protein
MDVSKMLQQVQQMQAEMAKAQEELEKEIVEASAGGGMVTVKASGALKIMEVTISPEAIDPDDPELLAEMVVAAVNQAIQSAQSLQETRLGGAMGGMEGLRGLGLPGL